MSWILLLVGLATMIAGGGAAATGWPLVPLERGWTLVISGSALLSVGVVCVAIAVLLRETRRTRLAIERALAAALPAKPASPAAAPLAPIASPPGKLEPAMPLGASVEPQELVEAMPEMPLTRLAEPMPPPPARPFLQLEHPAAAAPEPSSSETFPKDEAPSADAEGPADELRPARSFAVGDTTFVVFTNGTIEARTAKGAQRFDSMEEVRNYLASARA